MEEIFFGFHLPQNLRNLQNRKHSKRKAPPAGLEPATTRLRALRSGMSGAQRRPHYGRTAHPLIMGAQHTPPIWAHSADPIMGAQHTSSLWAHRTGPPIWAHSTPPHYGRTEHTSRLRQPRTSRSRAPAPTSQITQPRTSRFPRTRTHQPAY